MWETVFRKCRRLLPAFMVAMACVAGLALLGDGFAQTMRRDAFNHLTTGFPLTGAHEQAKCETCHQLGMFKGTARDCVQCHGPASRVSSVVMPQSHIPTADKCDVCHTTTKFYGVLYNHASAVPGSCSQCHNGTTVAPGKPAKHIVTVASCDTCHRVGAWLPATFSHTNVAPGSCAQCHNGAVANGKSSTHLNTTASCDRCHTTSGWIPGVRFDHAGVLPGSCSQCHDGTHAPGQKPGHPVTNASCDTCHLPSSWLPAKVDHTGVLPGTCASCHNGTVATGKKANHIPTTDSCDKCHNPSAWKPTAFNHAGVAKGACLQCHNGNIASGKKPGHLTTGQSCDSCHTTSGWLPVAFNHTGVQPGTCGNCHNGVNATGKTALHVPVTGNACDACHSRTNYTSFAGSAMNHGAVAGTACTACHELGLNYFAGRVVMRPSPKDDPLHPLTGDCIACHTTSTFANASGKPANHLPTSKACTLCHTVPGTYTGGVMNHQGITGNCAQCHAPGSAFAGVTPVGPVSGHIPYNGVACEACHSVNNFTSFGGTPMNHASVAAISCATCHETGRAFYGVKIVTRPTPAQSPTHPVTGDCGQCHTTTTFAGAAVKPANHLPTTKACTLCHTTPGTYRGGVMNHQGISSGCSQCHAAGSAFAGVTPVGPPAGHVPFSGAACEACHSVTNFTTFGGTPMNHAPVASLTCASCHETGKSFFGVKIVTRPTTATHPATGDCIQCHSTTPPFTGTSKPANHLPTTLACSACHANPQNYKTYAMSHQGIVANCAQCHGPGLVFATNFVPKAAPATHIPTNAAACEACHSATNFTTFGGTPMNHGRVASMTCATCHETGKTFFGVTMVTRPTTASHPKTGDCIACHTTTPPFKGDTKPANHIPTTLACSACHTTSDYSKAVMNHQGLAGNCAQCHGPGLVFATNFVPKAPPANHLPYNGLACEKCHAPTNFTTFSGTPMKHAGITSACITCHTDSATRNTAFFGVSIVTTGSPGPHVPLSYGPSACDTCHVGPYDAPGTFLNGITANSRVFHNNATVPKGGCLPCHQSPQQIKPTGPEKITTQKASHEGGKSCDGSGCHTVTSTSFSKSLAAGTNPWALRGTAATTSALTPSVARAQGRVSMPGLSGALATPHAGALPGQCAACHDGLGAPAKPARHLATALSCDTCHRTTAWIPASYRHADAIFGQCASCHRPGGATAKATNHAVTTASCDACHRSTGWLPLVPNVATGASRPTNNRSVLPGVQRPAK